MAIRVRGIEKWLSRQKRLVRVATVPVPAVGERWAIVWTLETDDEGDKVVLRLIEPIEVE